ncbi:MAG TPA: MtrB/PioB family outer membrane beta-barrel protein [Longimicrobiales bacterium]|nr:MtrB/PioB family outer membrane beta-barrel protein [Longimicrobiales bacterium]
MTTNFRACALALTCLAALAAARAAAQQVATPRLDGSIELGMRGYLESVPVVQRSKLEEYRDLGAGAFLPAFWLRYWTGDGRYAVDLRARDVARGDQEYRLRAFRVGKGGLEADWGQLPHLFATNARMLGSASASSGFTLPTPRPTTADWNAAPLLAPARVRWEPARAALWAAPSSRLDLRVEYTRIGKSGERPMGMAFGSPGSNTREILEPIDQTVHTLRLTQSYAAARWQVQTAYTFSAFRNDASSVLADNPLVATNGATTGAARGRTALAPDNVAHTVNVAAAAALPLRSRVNASVSYAVHLQDVAFLPHTINSAISNPGLALPRTALGGDVRTSVIDVGAVSRALPALTLGLHFRRFDLSDRTGELVFPAHVVNDRSLATTEPEDARRFPFSRDNARAEARWTPVPALALRAEYGWERWARDTAVRDVGVTNEHTPRLAADLTPAPWLQLHASVSRAWKRGDGYTPLSDAELPLLRRFDMADRIRDRADVVVVVTPIEPVTLSGTFSARTDDYDRSVYGLQFDRGRAAGADVTWAPGPRLALSAGYLREATRVRQRSKYRQGTALDNPTFDWVSWTDDVVETLSGSVTATIVPGRLSAFATWARSRATSEWPATNPTTPAGGTAAQNTSATATNLPTLEDELTPARLMARVQLARDWSASVGFDYERLTERDFRTDGLLPATGSDIFLGAGPSGYRARVLWASIGFRPALGRARPIL